MRELLLSLTCMVLFAQTCYTQYTIYRKGYIVRETGDTIKGFLGAKNWQRNPKSITFSIDSGNAEMTEYPGTILGYGFANGEHFVSGLLAFNDVAALAPLENCCCYLPGSTIYNLLFLRVLVKGPVLNLYEYIDVNGSSKFAVRLASETNSRSFITLVGTDVPEIADFQPPEKTYFFREQLKGLNRFGNSMQQALISGIIANATYSRESLIYTVSSMNIPCPPQYTFKEESHKENSMFFAVGLMNTTFAFQGTEAYLEDMHFNLSSLPYFKIGYEFHNAWKHPALTIRTSVASWGVNYYGKGSDYAGGTDSYSLHQFTIEPAVALLWSITYPGKKTEIFLGFEGGYNISFYKKNTLVDHYAGTSNANPNYVGLQPRWFNLNLIAGIYLNRRKWEITPFYQLAEAFAWNITGPGQSYSLQPRTYGIAVGFHFLNKRD